MTLNSFIAIVMLLFIAALAVSTVMVSAVLIKEFKKLKAEKQSAAQPAEEGKQLENI